MPGRSLNKADLISDCPAIASLHFHPMQKMMRMMKGGNQRKLMRQMEAMKGRGGFPGM